MSGCFHLHICVHMWNGTKQHSLALCVTVSGGGGFHCHLRLGPLAHSKAWSGYSACTFMAHQGLRAVPMSWERQSLLVETLRAPSASQACI